MGTFLAVVPGLLTAAAMAWLTTRASEHIRAAHVRTARTVITLSIAGTGGLAIVGLRSIDRIVTTEAVLGVAAIVVAGALAVAATPRIVGRYWDDLS